jgi:hypothetical protein
MLAPGGGWCFAEWAMLLIDHILAVVERLGGSSARRVEKASPNRIFTTHSPSDTL